MSYKAFPGLKAPLYSVEGTKGQINVVLPSELPELGTAFVEVTNAEGTSLSYELTRAPDSVGLFRIADPSNAARTNGAVLFANTALEGNATIDGPSAGVAKLRECVHAIGVRATG